MYCLVVFYKATKEELTPVKPMPKFLCVKFVVFFSFWQSVVIAVLAKLNAIPIGGGFDFYKNISEITNGIQDFCVCMEMFLAAAAHYFAFSHKPFIDPNADQADCCRSCASMWDVSDVKDDVIEHVKVIGKTVKKTVTAPLKGQPKGNSTEKTPLLQESTNSSRGTFSPASENAMTADVHIHTHGHYDPQFDTRSLSADWDSTSIDHTDLYQGRSTSTSMNNYFQGSSSIDMLEEDHMQRHSEKQWRFSEHGLDEESISEISEENLAQSPSKLKFSLLHNLGDYSGIPDMEVKSKENLLGVETNIVQSVRSSEHGDEQTETYHPNPINDVIC